MVQTSVRSKQTLHSRYNPQAEAEKYINTLTFRQNPRFFILIEPGNGYMIPPLKNKYPEAKIIALHIEEPEDTQNHTDCVAWILDKGTPLTTFLENEIPDTKAEHLQIIEWRPALTVYRESYLKILAETVEFIKRIDANKRTVSAFGERWFKNFFKILGTTQKFIIPAHDSDTPCIITGAGPCLEESLSAIKSLKEKKRIIILAVSASVPALRARDIYPDLIISTDGGNWALFHIYECLRGMENVSISIAASLFAALPALPENANLLLISDGSFWQNLILQNLKLPYINLAQRGTVSASAIDLALVLTKGSICISGMDLAHKDIQSHARPYSLDRFSEEKSTRLTPFYSQNFVRSSEIAWGESHNIYASWFGKILKEYPKRLYTLGNNHPVFGELKSWEKADWGKEAYYPKELFRKLDIKTIKTAKTNLAQKGAEILLQALENPHIKWRIKDELSPLLFPEEEKVSIKILCDKILNTVKGIHG